MSEEIENKENLMETSQPVISDNVETPVSEELTNEQIQCLFEQLKSIDTQIDVLKNEKEIIQGKIKEWLKSKNDTKYSNDLYLVYYSDASESKKLDENKLMKGDLKLYAELMEKYSKTTTISEKWTFKRRNK